MFDRIPENPGRVKITPENGGAAYYATMERADNPVQEGTPLNKETLLTDKTAALYEKDGNAVPNEIFESLYDARKKVGDIKVTLRTDLGEKWLLANGSVFDIGEYPALAEMLPAPTQLERLQQANIPANFYGADYANGICVSLGSRASSSGTYRWIGSLDGLNTFKDLGISSSWRQVVQYDEGSDTWVMAHYGSAATSFATKDPVNGIWTEKTISTMAEKYAHIHGQNGLWVAVGTQSSRNSSREVTSSTWVSTTTDPINGTWSTEKQIGNRGAGNQDYAAVFYHNGIWVIATAYEESASAGGGGGIVTYTTTDPVNGSWTMRKVASNSQSWYMNSIQAHDGTWVMTVYDGYGCYMYTTTDPVNGEWTASSRLTFSSGGATYSSPFFYTRCLRWHMGKWYALASANVSSGTACFLISTDNNGETWDAIDMGVTYGRSLCTDGKILIAQTTYSTSSNSAYYLAYKLPTITTDNAYTYIKAKE